MIGQWDPEAFQQWKAAPSGASKELIANRLYRENEPLVKTLVAQMLGQGERRAAHKVPAALRRIHRAEVVESWEDAMGVAGVAFTKFLRDYDPEQGRISFFLGMKIKYELQCLIERSENLKIPRNYDAECLPRGFDRYDAEEDFERASHQHGLEMAPDELLELGAEARDHEPAEEPRRVYSIPRAPLDVFLEVRLLFGRRGLRAPIWPLWNAWRIECAQIGREAGTRGMMLARLAARGARERVMKLGGECVRGIEGASLVTG